MALRFAAIPAASAGALFVPALATAALSREPAPAAPVELAQLEPGDEDPGNLEPDVLPSTDPGDEEAPEEVDTPIQVDQPIEKAYPVEPDSLLKAKTTPPPGAAAYDTLKAVAPAAAGYDTLRATTPGGAPARKPGTAPQATQRGTILGLSPILFFAGLLVVHVFVVKSVND